MRPIDTSVKTFLRKIDKNASYIYRKKAIVFEGENMYIACSTLVSRRIYIPSLVPVYDRGDGLYVQIPIEGSGLKNFRELFFNYPICSTK